MRRQIGAKMAPTVRQSGAEIDPSRPAYLLKHP